MHHWLHDIDFFLAMRMETLTPIIKTISLFGNTSFLLLLLPIGYWTFSKDVFSRWGLLLILNILLMAYLKDLLKDPRPPAIFHLDSSVGDSYGFPSGHAQLAVVAWLWLACEHRKTSVWILSSSLVIGVCFSRLYLGVHDLEDVIGGTVIGLLSIFLFAFICSRRFQFSNESRFLYQLFTLISIETFLFITWPARLRPEIIWTGFFLIGFWLGLGIESAYIRFKKHHNWCKVVISAVVGMIFFIFLRGQLQILIQELNHAKIFIFSIHACLCGIYVTALAPSIFKKLNLAEK